MQYKDTPPPTIRDTRSAGSVDSTPARTQPLADLHTIELNQVIFLNPEEVARIACSQSLAQTLRRLSIVDAYQDSIWGPRVRISDVESAVRKRFELEPHMDLSRVGVHHDHDINVLFANCPCCEGDSLRHLDHALSRVHEVVRCEAKVDRIMGGDRADTMRESGE